MKEKDNVTVVMNYHLYRLLDSNELYKSLIQHSYCNYIILHRAVHKCCCLHWICFFMQGNTSVRDYRQDILFP